MAGLTGKIIIVTGASSGIGLAAVEALLKGGCSVFGVDISPKPVNIISDKFAFQQIDLTLREAPTSIVQACQGAFGPNIHALLNVAGIMDRNSGVDDVLDEEWDRVIAVNLTAPVRLMREVINVMKQNGDGGSIVNVASKAGISGAVSGVAYASSKHALIGATKNTAWLLKDDGIRCNAIAPGAVRTNIATNVQWNVKATQRLSPVLQVHMNNKTGEVMEPDRVAEVLVFLVSDASQGVNGVVIPVDNAWSVI